jgi:aspartate/methionine/tyrosine aminotransferase
VKGVLVNRPNGAFYMSVCFENGALTHDQILPIENAEVNEMVRKLVSPEGTSLDKRFVYYLLGATGICVVPLTSFATDLQGFRVTLLERDEAVFRKVFETIAISIEQYLKS